MLPESLRRGLGLARFVVKNGLLNDVRTLVKLSFSHNQWWRKADDVAVGWLGEKSVVT